MGSCDLLHNASIPISFQSYVTEVKVNAKDISQDFENFKNLCLWKSLVHYLSTAKGKTIMTGVTFIVGYWSGGQETL